ncbi:MAG: hypothetical protein BMS9Abin02_1284 [Anaerolineae bacterium]|nr:MAG: hypothetical protein BMS9Abin02_1284 [Anaerolineae bacterium]
MQRKTIYGLLITVLMLIIIGPLAAQAQSEIEASLTIPDSVEYAVGDPIEMTLSVTHPADYQVIFPELEGEWADFLIMAQSAPTSTENDDGSRTTSQIIDARLFAPGSYETPPLLLTVADGAGQLTEVTVPPASVTIDSILVEGDNELRDIKPQAELPYLNILPWAIGGVVLLIISLLGLLLWRRNKRRSVQLAIDNRLPHEIALDELARINGLNLPEQGKFKEYYTAVSDIVRIYMGRTFHFPVLERTTREIQGSLKGTAVAPPIAKEFLIVLEDSDLVKFSKIKPSIANAMQTMARAYHIVRETKPELPAQESPPQNGNRGQGETSTPLTQLAGSVTGNGNFKQPEVKV